jgi:hypothetical protein
MKGFLPRPRPACAGNGALLVVVNSAGAYWNYAAVDETVLVALEHFGFPYRILDLAAERPSAALLQNCAAVVLAQPHVGGDLSADESARIAAMVKTGVGFIGLDSDLHAYQPALLDLFGFRGIQPYATNTLRIRDARHYITDMQAPGEFHTFDRMVAAAAVAEWGSHVAPLADGVLGKEQLTYIRHLSPGVAFEPGHYPLLFAGPWGAGRAVQFAISPRLWKRGVYGHARGLDDLFWRSLVWAARKPFAANMIPPFLTMSFDDCQGRHAFSYVDAANRQGYKPIVALFLRQVPAALYPKIRAGLEAGLAQYTTHALDYYTLLTYDFGKGEYSTARLEELFACDDRWWRDVGAQPGATVRFHWGEYGLRGLPYLKARGRVFICPASQAGLRKADQDLRDGYWPYGLHSCYYDYLPDDRDFFVFSAFLARYQEDFLSGATALLREGERNDVEKAAQNATRCIAHGLRAGFYAELCTHEQKFDVLSLDEWNRILARVAQMTAGYETMFAPHDEIARYLKGKDGIRVAQAQVAQGRAAIDLQGRSAAPLRLSIFENEGEGVRRAYRDVAAFDGACRIDA